MREPGRARWEHLDHAADIGVRGVGGSLSEAFEQAALAMTAVVSPLESVSARTQVHIECQGEDPELLLVDWLNSIIFEMATRKMLFSRFEVEVNGGRLEATAWGEQVDVARHHPAVEIKGATYTALRVGRDENQQWVAETVIDV
jgi:SHS2 domain-containing protein